MLHTATVSEMIYQEQSTCNNRSSAVRSVVSLGKGLFGPLAAEDGDSAHSFIVWFSPEIEKLTTSSHDSVASTATISISDDSSDDEFELSVGAWNASNVDKVVKTWELSAIERANLMRMGHRLHDIEHFKNNPADVIRFIRARPGNMDAAEAMFRTMIKWRIDNKVDTVVQDYTPSQELLDIWPGAVLQGVDKEGDPIHLARDGKLDGPALVERFGHDELIRFCIWLREKPQDTEFFQNYEKKFGRPMKRWTIIEDVGGIKVQNFTNKGSRNLFGHIMRLDQDYYPENAKRIIIIGVPSAFMMVWNTVKHFFDEGTVDKMTFSSSKTALKVLSAYVDLEVLPDCLAPGIGKGRGIEGLPSNFT